MSVKNLSISDVSETLLIPLYSRAYETQSSAPIIKDTEAVRITNKLSQELAEVDKELYRKLTNNDFPNKLHVTLSLRTRQFDRYVADFISREPEAVVVNIGCGLDTRFFRLDNKKALWYDLDFPEVIELKKQYISENERYHFIGSSALDFDWLQVLPCNKGKRFLFIAEGVFMYLPEDDVRQLVMKLQSSFPGSELVCEIVNRKLIKKMKKGYYKYKYEKKLGFGRNVTFVSGFSDGREFEKWNHGIEFLDKWTYFDQYEKKLGFFNLFGCLRYFKKLQWTVHYSLN